MKEKTIYKRKFEEMKKIDNTYTVKYGYRELSKQVQEDDYGDVDYTYYEIEETIIEIDEDELLIDDILSMLDPNTGENGRKLWSKSLSKFEPKNIHLDTPEITNNRYSNADALEYFMSIRRDDKGKIDINDTKAIIKIIK